MKLNAQLRISPSVMRLYETSHTLSELNTQQDHQELSTQRYTRQKWLDHISFTPHLDLSYPQHGDHKLWRQAVNIYTDERSCVLLFTAV